MNAMKVCYFGMYAAQSERNISIIRGLRKNNIEVEECRISEDQPHGRLITLFKKFMRIKNCRAILIGFRVNVQEVILARVLAFCLRIPLVTDIFYSEYQTSVHDRKLVAPDTKRARQLWLQDRLICRLSDRVLLDTDVHIDYFVREFGLPRNRFIHVFIGALDEIYFPANTSSNGDPFIVHFNGTFIPLHGIEYIVRAAKLLEQYRDIEFHVFGSGQTQDDIQKLTIGLQCKNIRFPGTVSRKKLAEEMAQAPVCLGIFGKTEKAHNVIPFKVFKTLAMAKPLITARTPAAQELLTDRQNCLFCNAGDPASLAEAIMELKKDTELRERIGRNGYQLFKERCTPEIIVRDLVLYLQSAKIKMQNAKRKTQNAKPKLKI